MDNNYVKIPEAMAAMAKAIKNYVDQKPLTPLIERVAAQTNQIITVGGVKFPIYSLEIQDYLLNSYVYGVNVYCSSTFADLSQTNTSNIMNDSSEGALQDKVVLYNDSGQVIRRLNVPTISFQEKWQALPSGERHESYLPTFKVRSLGNSLSIEYYVFQNGKMVKSTEELSTQDNNNFENYKNLILPGEKCIFKSLYPFSVLYEVDPAYALSWQDRVTPFIVSQNAIMSELLNTIGSSVIPALQTRFNEVIKK